MRLQQRYAVIIVALIAGVVVATAAILLSQFQASSAQMRQASLDVLEGQLLEQLRSRGKVLAEDLAGDLAAPLARLDLRTMGGLMSEVLGRQDVVYVFVHDADGRVVHDGTAAIGSFGRSINDVVPAGPFSPADSTLRRLDDVLELSRSILVGRQALGGVRVGLSVTPVQLQIDAMRAELDSMTARSFRTNLASLSVVLLALMAAGIIGAILVARSLTQPIARLIRFASRIGRGDYNAPEDIRRGDELGELADSFREMSRNLKASAGEVRYLAYHDSLTALPNRTHLKRSLQQAVARGRRQNKVVALLFIDLDDFKRVNDTLGHDAGDVLLKEFADRLQSCLRTQDRIDVDLPNDGPGEPSLGSEWIARLGGDEFTVVLEDLQKPDDAGRVAERILETLREPFVLGGQEVVVGASVGITTFPDDGVEAETLLRNADVAMYQAKERGKNHFQFFNDSMVRMATERLSLETDLRHAIDYDQLSLVYQPMVRTGNSEVIGVEAFMRWHHPALGQVRPELFIPLAEETGIIRALDRWACDMACRDLKTLHQAGFNHMCVAININSVHFRDTSVPDIIAERAAAYDIPPRFLRVELKEKTLMRNLDRAVNTLSELRSLGVSSWIDDFGAGNSPLRYLTRLPVDGLKIDGALIHDIAIEQEHRTIVSTLVAMGHSLGLSVMAEAVENQKQMDVLRAAECDAIQGFLFARPMLLPELLEFLRRNGTGDRRAGSGVRKVHILKLSK